MRDPRDDEFQAKLNRLMPDISDEAFKARMQDMKTLDDYFRASMYRIMGPGYATHEVMAHLEDDTYQVHFVAGSIHCGPPIKHAISMTEFKRRKCPRESVDYVTAGIFREFKARFSEWFRGSVRGKA